MAKTVASAQPQPFPTASWTGGTTEPTIPEMMSHFLRVLLMLPVAAMGAKTIYCFSCVTPNTYEVGMLAGMAKLHLGMFECTDYDIISNVSAEVLFAGYPEVLPMLKDHVHTIDMDLYVKKVKGPIGHDISSPATDPNSPLYQGKDATMEHLANTPVFKEVWSKIFDLDHFGKYDYTAKLDVDAVIVPQRLLGMLNARQDAGVAEYFQNAYHDMYGNFLHGPIELISRNGVYAFRDARDTCFNKLDQMAFGEDFFAKQCWEMIGIKAVPTMDLRLLYDDYEWGRSAKHRCDALNPDPMVFHEQQYFGVYHPRKSMETWLECRMQTGVPGIPSQAEMDAAKKLAGPGKPYDMKPVRLYDRFLLSMSSPVAPMFFLCGALLMMAGAVVVAKRKHTQRSLKAAVDTSIEAAEEGLIAELE